MKFIVAILIQMLMINNVYCAFDATVAREEIESLNLCDTSLYDGENTVTRNDCVSIIMWAIGCPWDFPIEGDPYGGEINVFLDAETDGDAFAEEYFAVNKTTYRPDIIEFARKYTDIIYGEWSVNDGLLAKERIYFNYNRSVTLKECVAFMVRCLGDFQGLDLDETFKIAVEMGLISDNDSAYKNPDSPISPDEFFVILQRFIHQKQYLFFDRDLSSGFRVNTGRNISYAEYLKKQQ